VYGIVNREGNSNYLVVVGIVLRTYADLHNLSNLGDGRSKRSQSSFRGGNINLICIFLCSFKFPNEQHQVLSLYALQELLACWLFRNIWDPY